jgi:hypothetical protein
MAAPEVGWDFQFQYSARQKKSLLANQISLETIHFIGKGQCYGFLL